MTEDRYLGLSSRLTPWKSISELEALLEEKAKISKEGKKEYAGYYEKLNPVYYNKGKEIARHLFEENSKDFSGLDFDDIYIDMVYCLHKYGFSFEDYCIFRLVDKSEKKRGEYVSDKLRYYYYDILNSPDIKDLMANKVECYRTYSEFYKREIALCDRSENIDKILLFIKTHPKFIYKPLKGHSGIGIQIIDTKTVKIEEWYQSLSENSQGIIEELIHQEGILHELHPNSVNTCRIVTFVLQGEVYFLGGILRMGVGKSDTDNAGSGGIYANLDLEHGLVVTDAMNYKNEHFLFHPSTGCKIIGLQLPEWESAKDLIRKMAVHKQGTTLMSWDIAYSVKGWLMVEANENGSNHFQSNMSRGVKPELYNLMDEYFKSKD